MLGVLSEFDFWISTYPIPLSEKVDAIKSLAILIPRLGPEIVTNLRHKFMMTLRTLHSLFKSSTVSKHAVDAWAAFVDKYVSWNFIFYFCILIV
jgi:hypothetical protein